MKLPLELLEPFKKIYVLVSGGIDSTYLAEEIMKLYPAKTFFVNCYNPYEISPTLKWFREQHNFIEIKPSKEIDYKKVIHESFEKIPKAIEARKRKFRNGSSKYTKKIFPCCKLIKHDAFKKDPLFMEEGSVIVSGIKSGDGTLRANFLKDLRNPPEKHNYASDPIKGFFHRHKEGQMFFYPFRDYFKRELPNKILKELRMKHPELDHSGCAICPVLVVFADRIKDDRVNPSVVYYNRMVNHRLEEFVL